MGCGMKNPTDDGNLPASGDNFTLAGPWRITTGMAWHDWQADAIEAEIKAAHANGDAFGMHRSTARLRRFKSRQDEADATVLSG